MSDGFSNPLHVAKAAMAMKRVCDVSGWKTSTAAYHQAVHDHLTTAADRIEALEAERDALRAEVERMRGLVKSVKQHADEWAISRMTGSKSLEQQKADLLWQEIRRVSASTAPIEASAALESDT